MNWDELKENLFITAFTKTFPYSDKDKIVTVQQDSGDFTHLKMISQSYCTNQPRGYAYILSRDENRDNLKGCVC